VPAAGYGFTTNLSVSHFANQLKEFVLWNPSLGDNSTSVGPPVISTVDGTTITSTSDPYAYPCTLAANTSYCVAVAPPQTVTATATPIETPAPRASGEVANCTLWYAPADQDDTCINILNTFGITFKQFYAMNPSVHNDCSGLVLGTHYCISTYPDGVPGGQPDWTGPPVTVPPSTPTTTTTTTSSGISSPSPVQTGIISTCNEFYRVISGDTCYDIALENDVPLSDFYTRNPAVKSDCSGLQADVSAWACSPLVAPQQQARLQRPAYRLLLPSSPG
jgi:hypothetical protein